MDKRGEELGALGRDLKGEFVLSYNEGKQVQEILNRYVSEELQPMIDNDMLDDDGREDVQKDIDYIGELAKLFD